MGNRFRPYSLLLLVLVLSGISTLFRCSDAAAVSSQANLIGQGPRVPIELFVMSRCPDARRAEARFDEVLAIVDSIADIRTIYIADEQPKGNLTCKHGPEECDGDVQQLCAARHSRQAGVNLGWPFIMCQNAQFDDVGSTKLAEQCLQTVGLSAARAARVRSCWSGDEGRTLLSRSAEETRRRGVSKSCTIYIGGQYRCTHDDKTWYDCPGGSVVEDFVATVCEQYQQLTGRWPRDVCGAGAQGGQRGAQQGDERAGQDGQEEQGLR